MGEVFSRPEYGNWLQRRSPMAWLFDLLRRFSAWLNLLSGTHPLLYDALFWGCVVLLVALLVHLGYTAWVVYQRTAHPRAAGPVAPVAGRQQSPGSRADALARDGRFTEALGWRFLALVKDLETRRAVDARASKTPAEYVAEARLDVEGRATLAGLVRQLYRHLFGAEPCDATAYAEFSEAARDLVRRVAPV